MKHLIIYLFAILALTAPLLAKNDKHRHRRGDGCNGKDRRNGYLCDNGKPCPFPDVPCAWRGRCVGKWEDRPCADHVPVTVSNVVYMMPTASLNCSTTVFTTVVPTVACMTFVVPGADNKNCKGERNQMVEELINKYAKSDAVVFLNGQEIEVKGGAIVVSGGTTIVRTGVVTVTGAEVNAANGQEKSMMGTIAAIMVMAGLALVI